MTDLAAFPDVEVSLRAVLGDLVPDADHIGVETPADPTGSLTWLPFIRVGVFGGSDNLITDTSRLDVETFAATRAEARDLAEAARQRMLNAGAPHVGAGFVLDHVVTDTRPHYVPYVDDPPPYRYTAAYTATARRSS